MKLGTGERYRSQVCTTEIIVVRGSDEDVLLMCGGQPLVGIDNPPSSGTSPAPGLDGGTLVGKRYADTEGSFEILATKAGAGTLTVGEAPLEIAAARQLPQSD